MLWRSAKMSWTTESVPERLCEVSTKEEEWRNCGLAARNASGGCLRKRPVLRPVWRPEPGGRLVSGLPCLGGLAGGLSPAGRPRLGVVTDWGSGGRSLGASSSSNRLGGFLLVGVVGADLGGGLRID